MTEPTPDEVLEEESRTTVNVPAEKVPDAEGLPDDVRDGQVEDGSDDAG